jgi:hypothetical protein
VARTKASSTVREEQFPSRHTLSCTGVLDGRRLLDGPFPQRWRYLLVARVTWTAQSETRALDLCTQHIWYSPWESFSHRLCRQCMSVCFREKCRVVAAAVPPPPPLPCERIVGRVDQDMLARSSNEDCDIASMAHYITRSRYLDVPGQLIWCPTSDNNQYKELNPP